MMRVTMENLLTNAWKYTGKTAEPEVSVLRVEKDGRPFVVVRDNGAGFSMEHGSQLFRPFQRLIATGERF